MFVLWLITGVLGYAHKIPIIGRIVSLLSLWYGRTTWWKILLTMRKWFILFNAMIGVFVVFKTTGFTPDLLLNNVVMMGHTYFEIFTNLTKKIFTWFVELFDHKVIPNIPGDKPIIPGSNGGIKTIYDLKRNPFLDNLSSTSMSESLRESYKDMFNIRVEPIPTSWYKDTTTWLWIGGIVLSLGGLYFGYKFLFDPTFIDNMNNSGTATAKPSPIDPSGSGEGSNPILNGIGIISKYVNNGIKKLNPLYWFMSSTDTNAQLQSFLENQNDIHRSNMRFYPFTEINPYDSWLTRMRISYLGETSFELSNRMKARQLALSGIDEILNSKPITESPVLGALSGFNSGFTTPRIGTVGLNNRYVSSGAGVGFLDTLEASTSFHSTFNKLSSLPATPQNIPTSLPEMDVSDIKPVNPSWTEHVINKEELANYNN